MRGGGQRSTYLLIKHLNKVKFSPFLAVPEKGELSKEVEKLDVKTFAVGFRRIRSFNIIGIIKDLLKIIKIIKDNKIDIIHTESPRQTIYCGIAGELLKVPLVMHLRVSNSSLWLDRILYFLSDYMIAVSNTAKNRFKFIDKGNRIIVVYNAVELDRFSPQEDFGNEEVLKIGYFGRIEERKGIDVLIRAVKRIDKDVKLIIQGEGNNSYPNKLKSLADGVDVEFRDYNKDVRSGIKNVDIVALLSVDEEGLSRIIIEAMAMGKLVIASDLNSNREVLGGGYEFFFPVGDDKALAFLIRKVLEDRDMIYKKRSMLRARAEELFDVKRNTKMIEEIYNKILEI